MELKKTVFLIRISFFLVFIYLVSPISKFKMLVVEGTVLLILF